MQAKTTVFVSVLVVIGSLLLIATQLSNFAVDITLSSWNNGAEGYQTALQKQKSSGKPVALFFHTDWCQNCKALRENVLSSPEFGKYATNIIPVKINPEIGPAERKIADKYGVFGYPTFLILDAKSNQIARISTKRNMTPRDFIGACKSATKV